MTRVLPAHFICALARARGLLALSGLSWGISCATSGDLSLGSFPGESVVVGAGAGPGGAGSGGDGSVSSGGSEGSSGGADTGLGGMGGIPLPCSPGAPLPMPVRRYDFSGTGDQVIDLQGGEPGVIIGDATLQGMGQLTIDGDDYVDLPNGILGETQSVSIVIWVTPVSGPAYWRIFDFGTSGAGEDPQEFTVGTYYVALTPETGFSPNGLAALIARGGPSSEDRALSAISTFDEPIKVTVVYDGGDEQVRLYYDGNVVAEGPLTGPLSDIEDVNNWLGRSQYTADPYFEGTYDELRIYDRALSGCEISALTALGPDNPG